MQSQYCGLGARVAETPLHSPDTAHLLAPGRPLIEAGTSVGLAPNSPCQKEIKAEDPRETDQGLAYKQTEIKIEQ